MYDDDFEYQYFENNDLSPLLKEGHGKFRVHQVLPKNSKSGNKMLEIMFMVKDVDGNEMPVFDYLVATVNDEPGMKRLATKIKNISLAIGKPELYAKNYKLKPQDLVGEAGSCMIKTQADKTGQYSDKSIISKYIDSSIQQEVVQQLDDDIPFM